MKIEVLAYLLITVFCSAIISGCGKHVYALNYNEVYRNVKMAKDPSPEIFVIDSAGNQLIGTSLTYTYRRSQLIVKLDGKTFKEKELIAWQDKDGFRLGQLERMVRGYLNLYYFTATESMPYVGATNPSGTFSTPTRTVVRTTSLYFGHKFERIPVTYGYLKEKLMNCQPALQQLNVEFGQTRWAKHPDYGINDFRALMRILTVFNSSNCEY